VEATLMNLRNTLILVAVFAVLGGYVYFVEMPKPATPPVVSDSDKYVFTVGATDLESLQIKVGEKSLFLVNTGGKWYIGGVGGAEADMSQLGYAITYLTDLKASRVITDLSAGLAAYGLEPPQVEAVMQLPSDVSETLLVGDKTPQGSAYYAQRKGTSAVYLIPEYLVVTLTGLVARPPYIPVPTVVVTGTVVPTTSLGTLPSVGTVLPTVSVTATSPITR
jgi:hypothetical protein